VELQKIFDLVLDNMHKVFFPEELIRLDLTISKTELLTMLVVDRYGEVIMSEIANHLNAPLSTTTALVNRLVMNATAKGEERR
jgi:DNA-binding MarR family transcriptional regulator